VGVDTHLKPTYLVCYRAIK